MEEPRVTESRADEVESKSRVCRVAVGRWRRRGGENEKEAAGGGGRRGKVGWCLMGGRSGVRLSGD